MNQRDEIKIFTMQKSGNKEDENEDSYGVAENGCLIALADGASDSFSARIWARLLTQEFVSNPVQVTDKGVFISWLESIQQKWLASINWSNLPWYLEEKARVGDFSSLLTLSITNEERNQITSHAIGDSCLFIMSENNCVSFPVENGDEFNNFPYLVPSYKKNNAHVFEKIKTFTAELRENDLIIMATDSIAKWILREKERGKSIYEKLIKMDEILFKNLVSELRQQKEMKNDDTTVILIR